MRWSEIKAGLLPRSGVGVIAPWLVIAPPGNPVIRIDLRLLDQIRVRSEEDDDDEEPEEAGGPVEDAQHDRRCELILSCFELDVGIYIADGPEAVERLVKEAAPFTREKSGTENTLPVKNVDAVVPPESTPANPKLVVLESDFAGKEFELNRPNMTIGRTDENDIIINHRSMSRIHARLVLDPATHGYTITDLDATNTVRVNGQDSKSVQLRHNDIVDLGHVRMRFVDPNAEFEIPSAAPPDATNFIVVGGDVVRRKHDEYIQVGSVAFRLDEVADYALKGANLPLPNGALLQAGVAMLVVAVNERDKASTCPPAIKQELLSALAEGPGLILVTGPTGHGKTTAIEQVLADSGCPPNVVFLGDIRGEVDDARRAVQLARSQPVIAVLRINRAAGAFGRLTDMGIPPRDLAEVVRVLFTTRLVRPASSEPVLLHERLVVTDGIRDLVLAGGDSDAVHRQAVADGMRSLRQHGLEHVRAGRLEAAAVNNVTPAD